MFLCRFSTDTLSGVLSVSKGCVNITDVSESASPKEGANIIDILASKECVNTAEISHAAQVSNQYMDCPFTSDQVAFNFNLCFNYQNWEDLNTINSLEKEQNKFILWKIERCEGHQITRVKGRLKKNIAFWQDVLRALAPVIDWIDGGYKLPLIIEPPS